MQQAKTAIIDYQLVVILMRLPCDYQPVQIDVNFFWYNCQNVNKSYLLIHYILGQIRICLDFIEKKFGLVGEMN